MGTKTDGYENQCQRRAKGSSGGLGITIVYGQQGSDLAAKAALWAEQNVEGLEYCDGFSVSSGETAPKEIF